MPANPGIAKQGMSGREADDYIRTMDLSRQPIEIPGPINAEQVGILHGMRLHKNAPDTLGDRFTLPDGSPMTKDLFDKLSPAMRKTLLSVIMGR